MNILNLQNKIIFIKNIIEVNMKNFKQYLNIINEANKAKAEKKEKFTIEITKHEIKDSQKISDKISFKTEFGFYVDNIESKWLWPKEEKVRWFNSDEFGNFKSAYWMPSIDTTKAAKWGIFSSQLWNKKTPNRATGRNAQDNKKGVYDLYWFKNINENELEKDSKNIYKITYQTDKVKKSILTFYGSSQDLLELL
jgi:hypothetical protein